MNLYIFGTPGRVGGAATKIAHLIRLLHKDFSITVVLSHISFIKDRHLTRFLEHLHVRYCMLNDLGKQLDGVALAVCEVDFFRTKTADEVKRRGLKLIWSNEMMWAFNGEEEAVKKRLIDRVLFVSEFQAAAFAGMYSDVSSFITGNYIDPEDYPYRDRQNPRFTIGRLSRADVGKYPVDFPVFYEELRLTDVKYRVMAWSDELRKQYRWHHFGTEWEFLSANKETAQEFLCTLDLFVYPIGHRVKESWGRAVVEAMLTGCIPLVPTGHQFAKFIIHEHNGFICGKFTEWQQYIRELYQNYALRDKISHSAADHARHQLCNPDHHRRVWLEALTF